MLASKRIGSTGVVLMAMLVFAGAAYAQSAGTGSIEGRVTDQTTAVVADSTVTLSNVATGASRTLQTDSLGNYRAVLLPPGTYEITVTKDGFGTLKRAGVNVEVGSVARINLEL